MSVGETIRHEDPLGPPATLRALQAESEALEFLLASEPFTGALLRILVATKPAAWVLELGTGTGVGTSWLLDGMDRNAHLISVDNDPQCQAVARRFLAGDSRVTFRAVDAAELICDLPHAHFDLIFADAWPGKYTHLDDTLRLLKPRGLYVIDDMLPQADWPEEHRRDAERLSAVLHGRQDLTVSRINWSSGIIVAVKREWEEPSGA